MSDVPKFSLYGENDPQIEEALQPHLEFRKWSDLEVSEKQTALQELINRKWINADSREVLRTGEYMNHQFMRQCPFKRLHSIVPKRNVQFGTDNKSERMTAAYTDFKDIFVNEKSEAIVLRMLSKFADAFIDYRELTWAKNAEEDEKREKHIDEAFKQFDRLVNCLNHIFEQFAINIQISRSGIIPKQDKKITENIYQPTLKALSDPKWKTVNDALAAMFDDFREGRNSEVITKAHSAVQRYLQILVGKEGKKERAERENSESCSIKLRKTALSPLTVFPRQ